MNNQFKNNNMPTKQKIQLANTKTVQRNAKLLASLLSELNGENEYVIPPKQQSNYGYKQYQDLQNVINQPNDFATLFDKPHLLQNHYEANCEKFNQFLLKNLNTKATMFQKSIKHKFDEPHYSVFDDITKFNEYINNQYEKIEVEIQQYSADLANQLQIQQKSYFDQNYVIAKTTESQQYFVVSRIFIHLPQYQGYDSFLYKVKEVELQKFEMRQIKYYQQFIDQLNQESELVDRFARGELEKNELPLLQYNYLLKQLQFCPILTVKQGQDQIFSFHITPNQDYFEEIVLKRLVNDKNMNKYLVLQIGQDILDSLLNEYEQHYRKTQLKNAIEYNFQKSEKIRNLFESMNIDIKLVNLKKTPFKQLLRYDQNNQIVQVGQVSLCEEEIAAMDHQQKFLETRNIIQHEALLYNNQTGLILQDFLFQINTLIIDKVYLFNQELFKNDLLSIITVLLTGVTSVHDIYQLIFKPRGIEQKVIEQAEKHKMDSFDLSVYRHATEKLQFYDQRKNELTIPSNAKDILNECWEFNYFFQLQLDFQNAVVNKLQELYNTVVITTVDKIPPNSYKYVSCFRLCNQVHQQQMINIVRQTYLRLNSIAQTVEINDLSVQMEDVNSKSQQILQYFHSDIDCAQENINNLFLTSQQQFDLLLKRQYLLCADRKTSANIFGIFLTFQFYDSFNNDVLLHQKCSNQQKQILVQTNPDIQKMNDKLICFLNQLDGFPHQIQDLTSFFFNSVGNFLDQPSYEKEIPDIHISKTSFMQFYQQNTHKLVLYIETFQQLCQFIFDNQFDSILYSAADIINLSKDLPLFNEFSKLQMNTKDTLMQYDYVLNCKQNKQQVPEPAFESREQEESHSVYLLQKFSNLLDLISKHEFDSKHFQFYFVKLTQIYAKFLRIYYFIQSRFSSTYQYVGIYVLDVKLFLQQLEKRCISILVGIQQILNTRICQLYQYNLLMHQAQLILLESNPSNTREWSIVNNFMDNNIVKVLYYQEQIRLSAELIQKQFFEKFQILNSGINVALKSKKNKSHQQKVFNRLINFRINPINVLQSNYYSLYHDSHKNRKHINAIVQNVIQKQQNVKQQLLSQLTKDRQQLTTQSTEIQTQIFEFVSQVPKCRQFSDFMFTVTEKLVQYEKINQQMNIFNREVTKLNHNEKDMQMQPTIFNEQKIFMDKAILVNQFLEYTDEHSKEFPSYLETRLQEQSSTQCYLNQKEFVQTIETKLSNLQQSSTTMNKHIQDIMNQEQKDKQTSQIKYSLINAVDVIQMMVNDLLWFKANLKLYFALINPYIKRRHIEQIQYLSKVFIVIDFDKSGNVQDSTISSLQSSNIFIPRQANEQEYEQVQNQFNEKALQIIQTSTCAQREQDLEEQFASIEQTWKQYNLVLIQEQEEQKLNQLIQQSQEDVYKLKQFIQSQYAIPILKRIYMLQEKLNLSSILLSLIIKCIKYAKMLKMINTNQMFEQLQIDSTYNEFQIIFDEEVAKLAKSGHMLNILSICGNIQMKDKQLNELIKEGKENFKAIPTSSLMYQYFYLSFSYLEFVYNQTVKLFPVFVKSHLYLAYLTEEELFQLFTLISSQNIEQTLLQKQNLLNLLRKAIAMTDIKMTITSKKELIINQVELLNTNYKTNVLINQNIDIFEDIQRQLYIKLYETFKEKCLQMNEKSTDNALLYMYSNQLKEIMEQQNVNDFQSSCTKLKEFTNKVAEFEFININQKFLNNIFDTFVKIQAKQYQTEFRQEFFEIIQDSVMLIANDEANTLFYKNMYNMQYKLTPIHYHIPLQIIPMKNQLNLLSQLFNTKAVQVNHYQLALIKIFVKSMRIDSFIYDRNVRVSNEQLQNLFISCIQLGKLLIVEHFDELSSETKLEMLKIVSLIKQSKLNANHMQSIKYLSHIIEIHDNFNIIIESNTIQQNFTQIQFNNQFFYGIVQGCIIDFLQGANPLNSEFTIEINKHIINTVVQYININQIDFIQFLKQYKQVRALIDQDTVYSKFVDILAFVIIFQNKLSQQQYTQIFDSYISYYKHYDTTALKELLQNNNKQYQKLTEFSRKYYIESEYDATLLKNKRAIIVTTQNLETIIQQLLIIDKNMEYTKQNFMLLYLDQSLNKEQILQLDNRLGSIVLKNTIQIVKNCKVPNQQLVLPCFNIHYNIIQNELAVVEERRPLSICLINLCIAFLLKHHVQYNQFILSQNQVIMLNSLLKYYKYNEIKEETTNIYDSCLYFSLFNAIGCFIEDQEIKNNFNLLVIDIINVFQQPDTFDLVSVAEKYSITEKLGLLNEKFDLKQKINPLIVRFGQYFRKLVTLGSESGNEIMTGFDVFYNEQKMISWKEFFSLPNIAQYKVPTTIYNAKIMLLQEVLIHNGYSMLIQSEIQPIVDLFQIYQPQGCELIQQVVQDTETIQQQINNNIYYTSELNYSANPETILNNVFYEFNDQVISINQLQSIILNNSQYTNGKIKKLSNVVFTIVQQQLKQDILDTYYQNIFVYNLQYKYDAEQELKFLFNNFPVDLNQKLYQVLLKIYQGLSLNNIFIDPSLFKQLFQYLRHNEFILKEGDICSKYSFQTQIVIGEFKQLFDQYMKCSLSNDQILKYEEIQGSILKQFTIIDQVQYYAFQIKILTQNEETDMQVSQSNYKVQKFYQKYSQYLTLKRNTKQYTQFNNQHEIVIFYKNKIHGIDPNVLTSDQYIKNIINITKILAVRDLTIKGQRGIGQRTVVNTAAKILNYEMFYFTSNNPIQFIDIAKKSLLKEILVIVEGNEFAKIIQYVVNVAITKSYQNIIPADFLISNSTVIKEKYIQMFAPPMSLLEPQQASTEQQINKQYELYNLLNKILNTNVHYCFINTENEIISQITSYTLDLPDDNLCKQQVNLLQLTDTIKTNFEIIKKVFDYAFNNMQQVNEKKRSCNGAYLQLLNQYIYTIQYNYIKQYQLYKCESTQLYEQVYNKLQLCQQYNMVQVQKYQQINEQNVVIIEDQNNQTKELQKQQDFLSKQRTELSGKINKVNQQREDCENALNTLISEEEQVISDVLSQFTKDIEQILKQPLIKKFSQNQKFKLFNQMLQILTNNSNISDDIFDTQDDYDLDTFRNILNKLISFDKMDYTFEQIQQFCLQFEQITQEESIVILNNSQKDIIVNKLYIIFNQVYQLFKVFIETQGAQHQIQKQQLLLQQKRNYQKQDSDILLNINNVNQKISEIKEDVRQSRILKDTNNKKQDVHSNLKLRIQELIKYTKQIFNSQEKQEQENKSQEQDLDEVIKQLTQVQKDIEYQNQSLNKQIFGDSLIISFLIVFCGQFNYQQIVQYVKDVKNMLDVNNQPYTVQNYCYLNLQMYESQQISNVIDISRKSQFDFYTNKMLPENEYYFIKANSIVQQIEIQKAIPIIYDEQQIVVKFLHNYYNQCDIQTATISITEPDFEKKLIQMAKQIKLPIITIQNQEDFQLLKCIKIQAIVVNQNKNLIIDKSFENNNIIFSEIEVYNNTDQTVSQLKHLLPEAQLQTRGKINLDLQKQLEKYNDLQHTIQQTFNDILHKNIPRQTDEQVMIQLLDLSKRTIQQYILHNQHLQKLQEDTATQKSSDNLCSIIQGYNVCYDILKQLLKTNEIGNFVQYKLLQFIQKGAESQNADQFKKQLVNMFNRFVKDNYGTELSREFQIIVVISDCKIVGEVQQICDSFNQKINQCQDTETDDNVKQNTILQNQIDLLRQIKSDDESLQAQIEALLKQQDITEYDNFDLKYKLIFMMALKQDTFIQTALDHYYQTYTMVKNQVQEDFDAITQFVKEFDQNNKQFQSQCNQQELFFLYVIVFSYSIVYYCNYHYHQPKQCKKEQIYDQIVKQFKQFVKIYQFYDHKHLMTVILQQELNSQQLKSIIITKMQQYQNAINFPSDTEEFQLSNWLDKLKQFDQLILGQFSVANDMIRKRRSTLSSIVNKVAQLKEQQLVEKQAQDDILEVQLFTSTTQAEILEAQKTNNKIHECILTISLQLLQQHSLLIAKQFAMQFKEKGQIDVGLLNIQQIREIFVFFKEKPTQTIKLDRINKSNYSLVDVAEIDQQNQQILQQHNYRNNYSISNPVSYFISVEESGEIPENELVIINCDDDNNIQLQNTDILISCTEYIGIIQKK